jgi:phenylpyruvate tautomerase PptA (4-oxalocrotonate tautomerase family)
MNDTRETNENTASSRSADGLSRRNVLVTATAAAGALASVQSALAETVPARAYGAPIVEVYASQGGLSREQRGAMIRGITDVVLSVTQQPPLGPDSKTRLYVEIIEVAPGGFGVNGEVFR